MGSWICYGLGSENRNLPGYVVLRDPQGYNTSGKMVWSGGWLPAVFQGTEFSSSGTPVHHLNPPQEVSVQARTGSLELLKDLNRKHLQRHPHESELDARIQNFELAARMQLSAPEVSDLSRETIETHNLYLPWHPFNDRDLFRYHGHRLRGRTILVLHTNMGLVGLGDSWGTFEVTDEHKKRYLGASPLDFLGSRNDLFFNCVTDTEDTS